MTFPSFIQTGGTRDLQAAPLEYKPFNLLPMIEQIRTLPKEAEGKKASHKLDEEKIKGRIGAVNQYYEPIDTALGEINQGVDLYGENYYSMPEYKKNVMALENAQSLERKNVVERQTADLGRYEKAIEKKGAYFHLGEWRRTGDLKKASTWKNILERGYTSELGKAGDYVEDFDFDPVLYDMKDAREEADAIFNPHGHKSVKGGVENIVQGFIGNMTGALSEYNSWGKKTNYGEDSDQDGIVSEGEKLGLDNARNQALQRAAQQMVDPTDKLTAGYLQGFFQAVGGLEPYMSKNGTISEENAKKFQDDFGKFMSEDLTNHFEKRKVLETEQDNKKSFTEQQEYSYNAGQKAKEAEEMLKAVKVETVSQDGITNVGMPTDMLLNDPTKSSGDPMQDFLFATLPDWAHDQPDFTVDRSGTNFSKYDLKNMLITGGQAPFTMNEVDGKTYVIPNENYDSDALYGLAMQKAKDAKHPNPAKFAEEMVAAATMKRNSVTESIVAGRGKTAVTRDNIEKLYVPTMSIGDDWWESVNDKNIIGQSMSEVGAGIFGIIGESYIDMSKLGSNVQYMGAEGTINFQTNTTPSNMYTQYIGPDGKLRRHNWVDAEWMALPDKEKDRILKVAEDQKKSGTKGAGTGLFNNNGTAAEAIESRHLYMPMDEWTQRNISPHINLPNAPLEMAYASAGAVTQTAAIWAKSEKEMAKALENVNVNIEVPTAYKSDSQYKSVYDKTRKDIYYVSNRRKGALTPEAIATSAGLDTKETEYFVKHYKESPNKSTDDAVALITSMKTKGLTNWNWNNQTTIKVSIPAASNGVIDPRVKGQLGASPMEHKTQKIDGSSVMGYGIRLPMNVTPVVMKNSTTPVAKKHNTFVTGGLDMFTKQINTKKGNPTEIKGGASLQPNKFDAFK